MKSQASYITQVLCIIWNSVSHMIKKPQTSNSAHHQPFVHEPWACTVQITGAQAVTPPTVAVTTPIRESATKVYKL